MNTFEDFLKGCLDNGHKQVRLVPRQAADGSVAFYAHGQCGPTSGQTFQGAVDGNTVSDPEVAQPTPEPEPEVAPAVVDIIPASEPEEVKTFVTAEEPQF